MWCIAGAVLFVAVDMQPWLSGRWVRIVDGEEHSRLLLYHVGDEVRAVFDDGTGGLSFEVRATGPREYRGVLSIDPIPGCGERFLEDSYVLRVSEDRRRLFESYRGQFGNPTTCEVWSRPLEQTELRRASN